MLLIHLFKANPASAIALSMALGTMLWCLRMLRRQHTRSDRYLMGLLGFMALYQGLAILKNAGIYSLADRMRGVTSAVDLALAGMCLASIAILRSASRQRQNERIQLRVAEANLVGLHRFGKVGRRGVMAVFGVNAGGLINLWHSSSEEFFGWRQEEMVGARLPFDAAIVAEGPRKVRMSTRNGEEIDTLVCAVETPDAEGSLMVVLDYERVRQPESRMARPLSLSRAETQPAG